jgi:hypothetical protein
MLELPLPRGCDFGVAQGAPRRAVINVAQDFSTPAVVRFEKEGAGPVEAKAQGKQSGWSGRAGQRASAIPSFIRLALPGPGTEGAKVALGFCLGQRRAAFSLRRVVSAFLADISSEALACGGVGEREQERCRRRHSACRL